MESSPPIEIAEIVLRTSHHTHYVIGSGSNDPQKYDPDASRETLDHSIPYILAVALEDRSWHHVDSYLPERARRASTIELWRKIRTVEDPEWTKRYHEADPARRAFGGTLEVKLSDGTARVFEKAVADAHPNGAKPWTWPDYVGKFDTLAGAMIDSAERERFIGLARGIGGTGARGGAHAQSGIAPGKTAADAERPRPVRLDESTGFLAAPRAPRRSRLIGPRSASAGSRGDRRRSLPC